MTNKATRIAVLMTILTILSLNLTGCRLLDKAKEKKENSVKKETVTAPKEDETELSDELSKEEKEKVEGMLDEMDKLFEENGESEFEDLEELKI